MYWFEEILIVLAYSTRTQIAILLGVISFIAILIYGHFAVDSFQLTGVLAPLTDVIKPYYAHRFEATAFGALFSFLSLAFKLFMRDRKRILNI